MYISMLKRLSNWVSQTKLSKVLYNRRSAKKLKWNPSWFGAEKFDDTLVERIIDFQKAHGLTPDGLVGPMTYRRVWTERQSNISDFSPKKRLSDRGENYIVHNGHHIPIEWDNVILWDEDDGFKANRGCYTDFSGKDISQNSFGVIFNSDLVDLIFEINSITSLIII